MFIKLLIAFLVYCIANLWLAIIALDSKQYKRYSIARAVEMLFLSTLTPLGFTTAYALHKLKSRVAEYFRLRGLAETSTTEPDKEQKEP